MPAINWGSMLRRPDFPEAAQTCKRGHRLLCAQQCHNNRHGTLLCYCSHVQAFCRDALVLEVIAQHAPGLVAPAARNIPHGVAAAAQQQQWHLGQVSPPHMAQTLDQPG